MNTTTENYIGHEELVTYLTSLAPISSLTMTKWQSIDITWYTHFLDEAKRLLDPNDFITIKDKENLLVPAETSQSNESLLPKFSETSQLTLISAETLQPDESLLSKKSFLPKVPETSQLTLTLQPDESLLPKKTVKVPNTETLQSDASLLSKMIINKIPLSESSQLNTPSLSNRQLKVPDKILSEVTQLDLPIKNNKLINFCYDIFHELENETYANLFYKYV
ncbi:17591_t:CDS:2 [Rhizophagus irregularis]|nr:17591_t:CDS:2 [Rhizophagus irregularis]